MASINSIIMGKGEKTILSRANDKSYSLRTTVPTGIVKQLDLKEGSSIIWKLIPHGKEFMIIIEPHQKKRKKK